MVLNVIFAAVVAMVPLAAAWTRWPRDRASLSATRRGLATIGLIGTSAVLLGFVVLALYAQGVTGVRPNGSVVNDAGIVTLALSIVSCGLCLFGRGVTRVTGALSASWLAAILVLATVVGV